MDDESLRAAYTEHLNAQSARGPDCVSPDELLGIATGAASEAERLRILRHVGSCQACRAELDLLRSVHEAAAAPAQIKVWRNARVLAAAAVLVVLAGTFAIWRSMQSRSADVIRTTGTSAVQLLAPGEDAVTQPPARLIWSAVPGANHYEVEVLRPSGEVVFSTTVQDTVLPLTDANLRAAGDYRWWVVAVLPEERRASPMRRLRIARP